MAVAVASYNKKYLRMKPEVKSIFDDLAEFETFVKLQFPQIAFNPADLYKNSSPTWQKFLRTKRREAANKR